MQYEYEYIEQVRETSLLLCAHSDHKLLRGAAESAVGMVSEHDESRAVQHQRELDRRVPLCVRLHVWRRHCWLPVRRAQRHERQLERTQQHLHEYATWRAWWLTISSRREERRRAVELGDWSVD